MSTFFLGFFKTVGVTILSAGTLISSLLGYSPSLGLTPGQSPALFETSLSAAIGKTDTSMTLVSGTTRDGTVLSGYYCFTIDSGLTNTEYVCGTASSTSVTGLIRGIGSNGTTSYPSLEYTHRYGADVKITDFPQLQQLTNIVTGSATFPNKITYDSSVSSSTLSGQDLVSANYANSLAYLGSPNGSVTTKGIYQESTKTQTAAGTATGSTGADLVVPNSYFNSTSSATTTVPVTNSSGKLDQNFINNTNLTNVSISTATSSATTTDNFNLLPAGIIQMYASTTAPAGWLICDGSAYSTSTYPRLFSVIGYTYGSSTAQFKIPDFRGRNPVGVSTTTPFSALGNTGGEINHTLSTGEFPNFNVSTLVGGPAGAGSYLSSSNDGAATSRNIFSIGSGTPFNVLDPYLTTEFIIKY